MTSHRVRIRPNVVRQAQRFTFNPAETYEESADHDATKDNAAAAAWVAHATPLPDLRPAHTPALADQSLQAEAKDFWAAKGGECQRPGCKLPVYRDGWCEPCWEQNQDWREDE